MADVLLDKTEQQCPGILTRCYADDLDVLMNAFWKEALVLVNTFQEFSQISGLRPNVRKCISIPLDGGI